MGYLLPNLEVQSIRFDKDDPSKATVLVWDKDDDCEYDYTLQVTLVDEEGLPIYGNHELIG